MSSLLGNALAVIGLALEFASVFLTARKLFFGYSRRLEEIRTVQQTIKKERREGFWILVFLAIGMALQGVGLFV